MSIQILCDGIRPHKLSGCKAAAAGHACRGHHAARIHCVSMRFGTSAKPLERGGAGMRRLGERETAGGVKGEKREDRGERLFAYQATIVCAIERR